MEPGGKEGREGRRGGGLGAYRGRNDWGPRGAGLGCLGSEEGFWGPNGADLGIWEVNLGYFWGVWGRKGWGLKGAGLGCLGIWGQIWVQMEQVWGPGGRFGLKESDLGCLFLVPGDEMEAFKAKGKMGDPWEPQPLSFSPQRRGAGGAGSPSTPC